MKTLTSLQLDLQVKLEIGSPIFQLKIPKYFEFQMTKRDGKSGARRSKTLHRLSNKTRAFSINTLVSIRIQMDIVTTSLSFYFLTLLLDHQVNHITNLHLGSLMY